MKKDIYRIFTTENGIRMSMDTMNYILENYSSIYSIESLLFSFKNQFNTPFIEIMQIKEIQNLKISENPFFKVQNFKYKELDLSEKKNLNY